MFTYCKYCNSSYFYRAGVQWAGRVVDVERAHAGHGAGCGRGREHRGGRGRHAAAGPQRVRHATRRRRPQRRRHQGEAARPPDPRVLRLVRRTGRAPAHSPLLADLPNLRPVRMERALPSIHAYKAHTPNNSQCELAISAFICYFSTQTSGWSSWRFPKRKRELVLSASAALGCTDLSSHCLGYYLK